MSMQATSKDGSPKKYLGNTQQAIRRIKYKVVYLFFFLLNILNHRC